MAEHESEGAPRGKQFESGRGPQLLAHLQESGAQVVSSDGKEVGDLKTVRGADFLVKRTLRRDLYVPIHHVQEVTGDNRIVLDVPADRISDMDWEKGWPKPPSSMDPDAANFSDSPASDEEPRKGNE